MNNCVGPLNTAVNNRGLLFSTAADLVRSHDLRDVRHAGGLFAFVERRFDLLSAALWVFNIDGDLTLTRAEGVHREHGRTHHTVPGRLDA